MPVRIQPSLNTIFILMQSDNINSGDIDNVPFPEACRVTRFAKAVEDPNGGASGVFGLYKNGVEIDTGFRLTFVNPGTNGDVEAAEPGLKLDDESNWLRPAGVDGAGGAIPADFLSVRKVSGAVGADPASFVITLERL